jgi:hypothetical protein
MKQRPVRTLITEPLTRCGVVDEDWKFIVISTICAFTFSIAFIENAWIMVLLTPATLSTGIILSVALHKSRPPRWIEHQLVFLFRRTEALLLKRHTGMRSPLPAVDDLLTVPNKR